MSQKSLNQPGSNDLQPTSERSRNQQANDTGGIRPNGERTMTNSNKTKQGKEESHHTDKSNND